MSWRRRRGSSYLAKMRIFDTANARQKLKKVWLPAGCAAAIVALLLLGVVGDNGYLQRRSQRRQIQALTAEVENLRQENLQLGQTIKDLRSDPDAIEAVARERLRLGRPGEVIITLSEEPPTPPPAATR
jgi:cell division protein FtsB